MSENGEVKGSFYRTEIIAQLFGVTVRRVQQLTQEGIISTTKILEDGKSVRRYDLVPTIQAYVKYLSDKAYGKQHRTDKEIELREQKMQADIALKESQGELHRLKTEIAAGQYTARPGSRTHPAATLAAHTAQGDQGTKASSTPASDERCDSMHHLHVV